MLDLALSTLEGIIAFCTLAVVGGAVWMVAVLKLQ
ncbi:hypothetical protein ABID81_002540 [Frigoribacterium sp. PvP054]